MTRRRTGRYVAQGIPKINAEIAQKLRFHSPLRLLTGSSLNTDIIGPTLPARARKRLTPREMQINQGAKPVDAAKTVCVIYWATPLPIR